MTDKFGREINYLRLSVTQRCNLKCIYCGNESPDLNELSVPQIKEAVEAFAVCGINKVRLTGGEPLVRDDIVQIAEAVKSINGIEKLALTTNGVNLKKYAYELKNAGVSAVNVSIDSLNRENYRRITGADCLEKVLEGLDEAEKCGLELKVNAVLMRGENDAEARDIINLARDKKTDVRFIELMPFSNTGRNESLVVTGGELLGRFDFLTPADMGKNCCEHGVAKYYEAEGFKGKIGLINPVSHKFCSECSRIRLLSDGRIKPCLGQDITFDMKPFFGNKQKLTETVKTAVLNKPLGHEFEKSKEKTHAMNKIGG